MFLTDETQECFGFPSAHLSVVVVVDQLGCLAVWGNWKDNVSVSSHHAMLQIVSLLHQSKTISSVGSFFPPDPRFSDAILQRVAKNREMQTVLSARSVSPLHSALPLELMELPLGCFSPQMGTAGGDPPPRAGITPSPTLTLAPSTPCCLLLLCCATARLQPSARGGVRGSSRRGRTTVMMSQTHICPQRRAGGGAALNCLHTAAPSHPSSPPPHGDQETDVVK